MKREDIELYVMGQYDGDLAALERELEKDPALSAQVAEEASLEALLRDAAAAATFCPACDELVAGERCAACGAAIRPGGYVVERVLVSNAHGRMYAARDADGTQVALKELAFVQSPGLDAVAAFEREARFLRALEHPAIPRFRASFQEGTGVATRYYLAQELVDGESLEARLVDHFFSETEIRAIARQVLDVLVYLQGLSPMVIHRDIKPANLVVRKDGSIAVVDFGAAHLQGSTIGATTIGTFGYMPIEQLAGEVDATTDGYALGASLMHLLTRCEPWRLLHGEGRVELNVSRPMRQFLDKLVAREPKNRYRTAADARAAVDRLERKPVSWAMPRVPLRAAVAVAAVFAMSGAGYGVYCLLDDSQPPVRQLRWSDDEQRQTVAELRRAAAALRSAADRARSRTDLQPEEVEGFLHTFDALADRACACHDESCQPTLKLEIQQFSKRWQHQRWNPRAAAVLLEPGVMHRMTETAQRFARCMVSASSNQIATGEWITDVLSSAFTIPSMTPGQAAPDEDDEQ